MGRAEDLFERLTKEKEQAIDAFIAGAVSEEMFLDYKVSATPPLAGKLADVDLTHFAIAISGYGNTEGGLIIWGVRCKSDPILGDVPDKKVPVQNPQRFKSWLDGLVSAVTVPAHSHVENFAFVCAANSSEGFIVTLVSKSDFAPHEVITGGKHQGHYMMRAGSSFLRMPHALLSAYFGRRPEPKLQLYVRAWPGAESGMLQNRVRQYNLIVGLHNAGRGIAIFPAVRIIPHPPLRFDGAGIQNQYVLRVRPETYLSSRPGIFFTGSGDDVIYPETTMEIAQLKAEIRLESLVDLSFSLDIRFDAYCEGFSKSESASIRLARLLSEQTLLF